MPTVTLKAGTPPSFVCPATNHPCKDATHKRACGSLNCVNGKWREADFSCGKSDANAVRWEIQNDYCQLGGFNDLHPYQTVKAHHNALRNRGVPRGAETPVGERVTCWVSNPPTDFQSASAINIRFKHGNNLPTWGDPGEFKGVMYFKATNKWIYTKNAIKWTSGYYNPSGNIYGTGTPVPKRNLAFKQEDIAALTAADFADDISFGFEMTKAGYVNPNRDDADPTALPNYPHHMVCEVDVSMTYSSTPAAVQPSCDFEGDGPHLEILGPDGTVWIIPIFWGDTVNFTDLSTNSPTAWTWTHVPPGFAFSTSQNPVYVWTSGASTACGTTYAVGLTATNAAGSCTVVKNPYVSVFSTTCPIGCAPGLVIDTQYVATYPPVSVTFSYGWFGVVDTATFYPGDGSSRALVAGGPIEHIYRTWGAPITASVANANSHGQTVVCSTTFTILDPRPQPDFVADTTIGPIPFFVTFTPSLVSGLPWDSLLWQFGDGETSNQEVPVHVYTETGVYTVTLVATNTWGSLSTSKVDYITAIYPTPSNITFDFEPDCAYSPASIQFTPYNVGTGALESLPVTWLWNFGDGNTSTEVSPAHLYRTTADTTYVPTLTLNNGLPSVYTTTAGVLTILGGNRESWGRFMDELGWHMMISEVGGIPFCDGWDQYGGYEEVFDIIVKRFQKFVRDTEYHVRQGNAAHVGGNVWTLPTNPPVVELLRVDADSVRLESLDHRQADLYDADWETAGTEPLGYIFEEGGVGQQRVKVVPTPAVPTFLNLVYVTDEGVPATPVPCNCDAGDPYTTMPLPYVYWWVLRFGVMAELFKREGEMQDVTRAQRCEEMHALGVELVKAMQRAMG